MPPKKRLFEISHTKALVICVYGMITVCEILNDTEKVIFNLSKFAKPAAITHGYRHFVFIGFGVVIFTIVRFVFTRLGIVRFVFKLGIVWFVFTRLGIVWFVFSGLESSILSPSALGLVTSINCSTLVGFEVGYVNSFRSNLSHFELQSFPN